MILLGPWRLKVFLVLFYTLRTTSILAPIITRSRFETVLDYKPWILGSKIEEFPCLVYKLFLIPTALIYKSQRVQKKLS